MYRFYTLLLFLWLSVNAFAQSNQVTYVSGNETESILKVSLTDFTFNEVQTPRGTANLIKAGELTPMLEAGNPDLLKFSRSLIIPDMAQMEVEIISSEYTEIPNIDIAPSKGNLLRTVNPDDVPYTYGQVYNKDKFFPGNLASLQEAYILRDHRGQVVQIFPFQYNPIQKTLRVYNEIVVRVFQNGEGGKNLFDRNTTSDKVSVEFNKIYNKHFINYSVFQSRYTPVEEEGNMLIICYDDWTAEMQDFVDWKNTIGRPTEMVTVTDAGGTAANIKTYVEDYYNTNGLTYLLLIGDAAQVPTNSGSAGGVSLGGHSDNAYGYISGTDHYQELFVGRFSAESPLEVLTQVQRTLTYEMGDQLAVDWLDKVMSVGSDQGAGVGDDGESDWQHLRNIQIDLFNFTYVEPPHEHFDGSQGGEDGAGNPTAAGVGADINTGTGIINYTGHGSTTSWSTSGFSVSNINSLVNENKLPFIWSVACVNGNFVNNTCFGEAWMRAENNSEPTGAIAIMASTINQSWAPPMSAQDEMVDLLVGTSTNGIKRTYAGLSVNGMFLMNDEYADYDMTDTWTCFGDPSLYVRTANPDNMTISHDNVLISGATNFDVNGDFDGALATLSDNGVIVGSAVVTSGIASIEVPVVTPGTTLTLAVVGFNKVSYLADINVIAPSGSYLLVEDYQNSIVYGSSQDLDVSLKNVGTDTSVNASIEVSTADTNATLSNTTYTYGDIAPDTTSDSSTGALTLSVANNLPDQYNVEIEMELTDDSDTWTVTRLVTVQSPNLVITNLVVDDTTSGNGDGILDPDESADLIISVVNEGHADVENINGLLSVDNADITINTATDTQAEFLIGETKTFTYNVSADAAMAPGTAVIFTNDVTYGVDDQYSTSHDFEVIVGFVPEYCASYANYDGDSMIEEVAFGSVVNNTSAEGCATYSDYTDDESMTDSFAMGSTNDISFYLGTCNGTYTKAGKVYIDWNYDGDFEDADEMVYESIASNSNWMEDGTFTVPTGLSSGPRFMRIVVSEDENNINPCGTYSWGETEDYKIYIYDPLSVDDNVLMNVSLYPNPNNGTFTLDLSGLRSNIEHQVEVFDLQGKVIKAFELSTARHNLELNVESGVYLVRITSENNVSTRKIIIK